MLHHFEAMVETTTFVGICVGESNHVFGFVNSGALDGLRPSTASRGYWNEPDRNHPSYALWFPVFWNPPVHFPKPGNSLSFPTDRKEKQREKQRPQTRRSEAAKKRNPRLATQARLCKTSTSPGRRQDTKGRQTMKLFQERRAGAGGPSGSRAGPAAVPGWSEKCLVVALWEVALGGLAGGGRLQEVSLGSG